MLTDAIVLQSAGSLSVAILALIIVILQVSLFLRTSRYPWYIWGAIISFSAFVYSMGVFVEYNTSQGPVNRISGLLEFTAVVFLIHGLYGFTFSYFGINSRPYHYIAGTFHGLLLNLLWFSEYIVTKQFIARNFMGLKSPYVEPALGILGPTFVLYAALASMVAIVMWIRQKSTNRIFKVAYLLGMGFWIFLGTHDALASLGMPTYQYIMEYGFLGFAVSVLWVVFNSYLNFAAEDKYRMISQRERAEASLRESEERYRQIFNIAPAGIYEVDFVSGKLVSVNNAICEYSGYSRDELLSMNALDLLSKEGQGRFLNRMDRVRKRQDISQTVEIPGSCRKVTFWNCLDRCRWRLPIS